MLTFIGFILFFFLINIYFKTLRFNSKYSISGYNLHKQKLFHVLNKF